ncbi:MAG TPA: hypothetical protein VHY08_07445 [Bacillota bacterium]|nr:hypothetical protein [Bacillota bacterium]
MKKEFQMILGYVLGGLFFIVLIPSAINISTTTIDKVFKVQVIPISDVKNILSILLLIIGFSFAVWSLIIQNIIGQG